MGVGWGVEEMFSCKLHCEMFWPSTYIGIPFLDVEHLFSQFGPRVNGERNGAEEKGP